MSLVDADTGEVVADISPEDARTLTDRIKIAVEGTWDLIRQAYTSRAWAALGHPSWDDYCTREFGTSRLRLPREERSEVVASLRDSGLSIRAIASATGTGTRQVQEALRSGVVRDHTSPADDGHKPTPEPRPIVGTDGKTYTPPPKPETPPTPRRPSLVDAVNGAESLCFFDDLAEYRTAGSGDPRHALLRRLNKARDNRERLTTVSELYLFLRVWNAVRTGEALHRLQTGTNATVMPEPV